MDISGTSDELIKNFLNYSVNLLMLIFIPYIARYIYQHLNRQDNDPHLEYLIKHSLDINKAFEKITQVQNNNNYFLIFSLYIGLSIIFLFYTHNIVDYILKNNILQELYIYSHQNSVNPLMKNNVDMFYIWAQMLVFLIIFCIITILFKPKNIDKYLKFNGNLLTNKIGEYLKNNDNSLTKNIDKYIFKNYSSIVMIPMLFLCIYITLIGILFGLLLLLIIKSAEIIRMYIPYYQNSFATEFLMTVILYNISNILITYTSVKDFNKFYRHFCYDVKKSIVNQNKLPDIILRTSYGEVKGQIYDILDKYSITLKENNNLKTVDWNEIKGMEIDIDKCSFNKLC